MANSHIGANAYGIPRYMVVPIGHVPYSMMGTETVPVAGTFYISQLEIPRSITAAGAGVLLGNACNNTQKAIVSLWDAAGNFIVRSTSAGTTVSPGPNQAPNIAFNTPTQLEPGLYHVGVTWNGSGTTIRTISILTYIHIFGTSDASVAFGTNLTAITPPTSLAYGVAPFMWVYSS